MSLAPTIGGKLREGTPGDTGHRLHACWGSDPVKEIGQSCGLNVIMRRSVTSHRSVVTAVKLVYSTWKLKRHGERNGKNDLWGSICIAIGSLAASGWRTSEPR